MGPWTSEETLRYALTELRPPDAPWRDTLRKLTPVAKASDPEVSGEP